MAKYERGGAFEEGAELSGEVKGAYDLRVQKK